MSTQSYVNGGFHDYEVQFSTSSQSSFHRRGYLLFWCILIRASIQTMKCLLTSTGYFSINFWVSRIVNDAGSIWVLLSASKRTHRMSKPDLIVLEAHPFPVVLLFTRWMEHYVTSSTSVSLQNPDFLAFQ